MTPKENRPNPYNLTDEQVEDIRHEYPRCTDTEAMAKRYGLKAVQLTAAANKLGITKDARTISAIHSKYRNCYAQPRQAVSKTVAVLPGHEAKARTAATATQKKVSVFRGVRTPTGSVVWKDRGRAGNADVEG